MGLGSSAVDLVGQDDLSHDRTGAELELPRLLVKYRDARHIAGQHVGRELDAPESATDGPGYGLGQHGLTYAGHIFNKSDYLWE